MYVMSHERLAHRSRPNFASVPSVARPNTMPCCAWADLAPYMVEHAGCTPMLKFNYRAKKITSVSILRVCIFICIYIKKTYIYMYVYIYMYIG